MGIPAHHNGRNHFRLPENNILPLYCLLPLRWVENPPYGYSGFDRTCTRPKATG
ncbi:MAG: hypothetical protein J5680_04685 [Neisseriaceae bacterium]|nr:hypothetical protein [Neisseriaceae bacterium]